MFKHKLEEWKGGKLERKRERERERETEDLNHI